MAQTRDFVLGMFVGAGLAMVLGGIIVRYTVTGGTMTLPLIGVSIFAWQLT